MGSVINEFLLDNVAHRREYRGFDRGFSFKMLHRALTQMKFKEQKNLTPRSVSAQFLRRRLRY